MSKNKIASSLLVMGACVSILGLSSTAAYAENAQEQEYIPIPPKRPAILNVSPAYIAELKNRNTQTSPTAQSITDELLKAVEAEDTSDDFLDNTGQEVIQDQNTSFPVERVQKNKNKDVFATKRKPIKAVSYTHLTLPTIYSV